jgi:hypothetical protein
VIGSCGGAPATVPDAKPQREVFPPKHDPRLHACNDGRLVEFRLGLLTGAIDRDPLVLREQALLAGVRSEGVLTAYDHGVVLGGVGEAVTVTHDGAWRRVALDPKDLLVNALAADFDGDSDDDLLLIVQREVVDVPSKTATYLPFAHVFSQEPDHGFALRSTLDMELDAISYTPLLVAELTGDGKLDFVVIQASQPIVYRGDGALRFERQVAGPRFPLAYLNSICSGLFGYDRDGDADTDLLALCEDGSLTKPFMFVFDNAGQGRFVHGPSALIALHEGARAVSELQDLTRDGKADVLIAHFGSDAEPRLALLRGSMSPIKLDVPEPLPIASAVLASAGAIPRLFTARSYGPGGITQVVTWPTHASKLMTFVLGKNRGDGWVQAEHRIETDTPAAIAVRDSAAADRPPTVHVLLDIGCSPPCTPECERCMFDRCVVNGVDG